MTNFGHGLLNKQECAPACVATRCKPTSDAHSAAVKCLHISVSKNMLCTGPSNGTLVRMHISLSTVTLSRAQISLMSDVAQIGHSIHWKDGLMAMARRERQAQDTHAHAGVVPLITVVFQSPSDLAGMGMPQTAIHLTRPFRSKRTDRQIQMPIGSHMHKYRTNFLSTGCPRISDKAFAQATPLPGWAYKDPSDSRCYDTASGILKAATIPR